MNYRILFIILSVYILWHIFGIYGVLSAALGSIILLLIIPLFQTYTGIGAWDRYKKEYDKLIAQGSPKKGALIQILKASRPGFGDKTYQEIVNKYDDIDLLSNFIIHALPRNISNDIDAITILDNTIIYDYRGRQIRVFTDPAEAQMFAPETIKDKYQYLMNRGKWHLLGEEVIKKIVSIFEKENATLFKEFVDLSEFYKTLDHYSSMANAGPDMLLVMWATTLQGLGCKLFDKYQNNKDTIWLKCAISCFRIANLFDKDMLTTYFSIAIAYAAGGERDRALHYINMLEEQCKRVKQLPKENLTPSEHAALNANLDNNSIDEFKRSLINSSIPDLLQAFIEISNNMDQELKKNTFIEEEKELTEKA